MLDCFIIAYLLLLIMLLAVQPSDAYPYALKNHHIKYDVDHSSSCHRCWHQPFRDSNMQQLSSQRLIRSNHHLLYSLINGEDREAPTLRKSSSMLHGLKPSSSGDIRDTQLIANSSDRLAEGSNKYLLPLVLAGTILTVAGLGHYVDLDSISDKAVKFLADAGPYGYAYFALVSNCDNYYHTM